MLIRMTAQKPRMPTDEQVSHADADADADGDERPSPEGVKRAARPA
jgi:hypothetical protein